MTRRSKSQNHTKTLICNYKCTMDGTRCTALQSPSADNVLAQYVTLGRNHVLVPIYQVDSWEHFIGHRLETNSLASQEFQPARPPPPLLRAMGRPHRPFAAPSDRNRGWGRGRTRRRSSPRTAPASAQTTPRLRR